MKIQFLIKIIIWEEWHDVYQVRKNPRISYYPRTLAAWKSQSIIYVKEHFYMFFSTLKDIQAQSKTDPRFS